MALLEYGKMLAAFFPRTLPCASVYEAMIKCCLFQRISSQANIRTEKNNKLRQNLCFVCTSAECYGIVVSICQLHQKAHRKTDNKFNSKTFASCSLRLGASQKYFHIHLMISALELKPKSKCKFFHRNLRISLSPAMVFHVFLLPYHALCFDVYCHLISKFPYAIPGFT